MKDSIFRFNDKGVTMIYSQSVNRVDDILKTYPNDKLWICIPLSSKKFISQIELLIEKGFTDPYICDEDLKGDIIPLGISMVKSGQRVDKTSIINGVYHCIKQYKDGNCKMTIRLDKDTIEYLKKTPYSNDKETGRELSGKFTIQKIHKDNNDFLYTVSLLKDSIKKGEKESINIDSTRYNFHSHPEDAYKRHNTKYAWPSSTDYVGFLELLPYTSIHIVATIEGIYIISLSRFWCDKYKKIDKGWVKNKYKIHLNNQYTPTSYIKMINNIKYKGSNIFDVKYKSWEKADTPFDVYFIKNGKHSCIVSDQGLENYISLGNKKKS